MSFRELPENSKLGPAPLLTAFYRSSEAGFSGHVADLANLDHRYVVELLLDGVAVRIATAHDYSAELARDGVGDGCYGFSFELPASAMACCECVEARVANMDIAIGPPVLIGERASETKSASIGMVEWLGGLRFRGAFPANESHSAYVNIVLDGETIAQAITSTWRHVEARSCNNKAVPGFDVHLPARLADGKVRQARFIDAGGEELAGSPVKFTAFEDGLQRAIASLGQIETEKLRGELFDRLMPMSLPFASFKDWSARFLSKDLFAKSDKPIAIVLVGSGDAQASLETLEHQNFTNWVGLTLPFKEESCDFEAQALQTFLQTDASKCETILFLLAGTRLDPQAIGRFAEAWAEFPDAKLAYGDFSIKDESGRIWPVGLPAFDYERMLEQGLGAFLFAAKPQDIGGVLSAGTINLFRLFNILAGGPETAPARVIHVPRCLGTLPAFDLAAAGHSLASATRQHLLERGAAADVERHNGMLFPAVHVMRRSERPSVSVIIPVRNRADLLLRCLETIAPALEKADCELIIVDNDSSDEETLELLDSLESEATVLRVPGPFNFAKLNNRAAEIAKGEALCLLNNDIEALDDIWLDEMLSRVAEQDVGAVGALLVWPTGVIQHGGIVLGSSLSASHAFSDRLSDDPGYGDLMRVAHQCSAVTAACLVTPRVDYLNVGGLDEVFFPVNYNDIDYCLKLRALGKRIVFTPHAKLLHHESVSRGKDLAADRAGRFQRELRSLRARWLESLIDDPFYNPMLSLDPIPFSALAWPPRSMRPRLCVARQPLGLPSGM